jgi:hypothetical protein
MNLPECPLCAKGKLLPISGTNGPYQAWVCMRPDCKYTVGDDIVYYKGTAAVEEVAEKGKEYTKFDF